MTNNPLRLLVYIEVAVLALVATGVFIFLTERYQRALTEQAEQSSASSVTQVVVVYVPATVQSSATPSVTRTPSPSPSATASATASPSPSPTLPLPPTVGAPTSTQGAPSPLVPTSTRIPPTSTPVPPTAPPPTSTRAPAVPTAPPTDPPPTPTRVPVVPTAPPPTSTPRPARTTSSGTAWRSITQCALIDAAGNYRLDADLAAGGDCIRVQTSYAIVDCAGHAIRNSNFGGAGIAVRKYGVLGNQSPAYIEIRNCRVSGFRYGILVEGANNVVVHDNDSSNNYDDVDPGTRYGNFLGMTDGGGIRLNNTIDSYVFANTTKNQAIGIDVRYSSGIKVRSNTSSGNSAWGVNFYASQNGEITNNVTNDNVRRCTWGAGTVGLGCDAGGIAVQGGSNGNMIAYNQVGGQNGNGIFIKAHAMPCGSNNSIIGNTITSVLYNSVELGFCTDNKINGNAIRDGLDGIWIGYARDTEIRNNTISNMRNHGVISSNSHNILVTGNQITNSNEGIYFYSENVDRSVFGWLPQDGDYRSHDNCLCGNTIQSNLTAAIHLKDTVYNQVTNNNFQGNGRTIWSQGNGTGNNTSGNVGWLPALVGGLLARR